MAYSHKFHWTYVLAYKTATLSATHICVMIMRLKKRKDINDLTLCNVIDVAL